MNKLITALAASVALASSAFAYSNLADPAKSDIGTSLSTYKLVSDGSVYAPNLNPATSPLFTADSTTVSTLLANTETKGGYLRTIFLGETAGYTLNYLNKALDGSSTRTNVFGPINAPTKITFADYVDVTVPKLSTLQLFLNSQAGYEFPIFTNGVTTNVAYSIRSYTVKEYLTSTSGESKWYDVPTYVIGVEDLSAKQKGVTVDWDYNDVVFAIQFLKSDGTPNTPVPEPSTYGLLGAAALVGLVAIRRFKSKK